MCVDFEQLFISTAELLTRVCGSTAGGLRSLKMLSLCVPCPGALEVTVLPNSLFISF